MEHCALASTIDFIKQLPQQVEIDDAIVLAYMSDSRMANVDNMYAGETYKSSIDTCKRLYAKDIRMWYSRKLSGFIDSIFEYLLNKASDRTNSIAALISSVEHINNQNHTNTSEAVNDLNLAIMEASIETNRHENKVPSDSQRANFFARREDVLNVFHQAKYKHFHTVSGNNDNIAWKVKVLELILNCIQSPTPLSPVLRPVRPANLDRPRIVSEFSALVVCKSDIQSIIQNTDLCGVTLDILSSRIHTRR